MPFPRKVWIHLLCSAFTKPAIELVHKQNRVSGKTIYLPSWGRYFRIGEAGFPVFSQGVEIKKPRAVAERIEPGLSMKQLFLCVGPHSPMKGRPGLRLCEDRIWCRMGFVTCDVEEHVCRTPWEVQWVPSSPCTPAMCWLVIPYTCLTSIFFYTKGASGTLVPSRNVYFIYIMFSPCFYVSQKAKEK